MGEFVAVSAFRTEDPDRVAVATGGFFASCGWPAESTPDGGPVTDDDVLVHPSAHGRTVVLWPRYFADLPAVEFASRELGVLASTVRIHDGDYWSHALVRDGAVLDRFASMPDYHTDDPARIARLAAEYAGRPDVVADAVGCSVERVAPYFVRVEMEAVEDDEGFYVEEPELGRAFPDDGHELDDPWVFVDFWRRIGPRYPADPSAHVRRIRLAPGWFDALPAGDMDL